MCAGPPGVYSPDVAGLYMSEQHMMRPPGEIKVFHLNDLLCRSRLRVSFSFDHLLALACITLPIGAVDQY